MELKGAEAIAQTLQKQSDDMRFPEGATDEEITNFEKSKGVRLPQKLKEWLKYADGGDFFLPGGPQIYGISHKPFINIDDDDRPDDDYIVIGRMSWGDPIVYKKGEEWIAIYDHDNGEIDLEAQYVDFFEFLNSLFDLLGIGE